ncbi:DUF2336 domain-containing protein [Salinarimonas soli]|uniref:DUF2336 domain-containing protein n=1 Tax=Salinarimonas soli TaxID=1638099 RepID=A0A5B2VII9_9HYPH|nr:DUF2336 domain-containing protein [Salinarimonas soli]KAA2237997.1 DUF2336 domain-containing protein [Salinarimonas soli]
MIVRRFLSWVQSATPGERAEGVSSLARTLLYADLSPEDRREAETALTAMLDDPSPLVRRAMAEAFANAAEAPAHLVLALANDQSDVAALVLARSPLLDDHDLVDCAALGDEVIQAAVASRPRVSAAVAAALAEIAGPRALAVLVENHDAAVMPASLARIVERHGDDGALREALLARPDLPLEVRQAVSVALAQSLGAFVVGCGWLSPERCERAVREAREKTAVALATWADPGDAQRLVAHLRRSGQLTPALILRAILSRGLAFAEAAFAELTGLPPARVAGLIHDRRSGGLRPLYKRAGLPEALRPAFEAALAALRETGHVDGAKAGAQLSRRMVERVLTACAHLPPADAGKLMALLRRFEVEAAREEAREQAEAMADEAALAAVLAYMPQAIAEAVRQQRALPSAA